MAENSVQTPEKPKQNVFIYGTLKKGQPNAQCMDDKSLGEAQFISAVWTVEKWPLIVDTKYNIPYLLWAKGHGKKVYGELYAVDDKKLSSADQLEHHPRWYERDRMKVTIANADETEEAATSVTVTESNGSNEVECWCYFLKNYESFQLQRPTYATFDNIGGEHPKYISVFTDLKDGEDPFKDGFPKPLPPEDAS